MNRSGISSISSGRVLFFINLLLMIVVGLTIINCGSTSSGIGPGYDQKDVRFSMSCSEVNCQNRDVEKEYDFGQKLCTWNCGNYKGETKRNVLLWFKKDRNNCWYLFNESYKELSEVCK